MFDSEFFIQLSLISGLTLGVMMLTVWLLSLKLNDVSIVDAFWGFGFGLAALTMLYLADRQHGVGTAQLALVLIVCLWSLRLGGHLLSRWFGEAEEDRRYQAMRQRNPGFRWRSLYIVFALQGALIWLVALPLQVAFSAAPVSLDLLGLAGAAVAVGGLSMETLADIQLTRFRNNPANAGKILDTGLWACSRHPNYFGDATFWWGVWLICVSITPAAIAVFFAPLLMNYLIVKISGAELLEHYLRKNRPGYEDYIRRTNRFIPRLF